MELREQLQSPRAESVRTIEPPDITDFLLFGKPPERITSILTDDDAPHAHEQRVQLTFDMFAMPSEITVHVDGEKGHR